MYAFDLDTNELFRSATDRTLLSELMRKWHDTVEIPVRILRSGVPLELQEGATGKFGLKAKDDFSGLFKASASFVKQGSGANSIYRFTLPLNSDGVNALFPSDSVKQVILYAELEIRESGRVYSTTQEIKFTILNDYIKGDEGQSESANPQWGEPGEYLRKDENLSGLADVALARQNLGLAAMFCRTPVAGPVTFATAGSLGEYWFDDANDRLWVYVAGQFRYTTWIST